jgi:hypothetical protein
MSTSHRPLCPWVARLNSELGSFSSANDGDDRSDARHLVAFATGWDRVAVPWDNTTSLLGLSNRANGAIVVELDDFGSPVPASGGAVETIRRIERHWAVEDGTEDFWSEDFRALADESLTLRYWLLERLEAESEPPDEAFEILPWDLLDTAVDAVLPALSSTGPIGELVEIRHWLTPAVRGVTSCLEQLDHGLRTGDGAIARLGASALLTSLRNADLSRVPPTARAKLSLLVEELAAAEPSYGFMARLAMAGLDPDNRHQLPPTSLVLRSSLEAAANSDADRQLVEDLGDQSLGVRVIESAAGKVRVYAHAPGVSPQRGPFTGRPARFLSFRVVPREAGHRQLQFWIALYPEAGRLVGSINFALPYGLSDVEIGVAPVSAEELDADPDTLLQSLHASVSPSALIWLNLAGELPPDHPVRIAATRFEEES